MGRAAADFDHRMRASCYWLGVVLLLAGAGTALAEILTIVQGAHSPMSLGAIWYRIHANSLVGFQGLIERGISPALWPPVQFVLTIPSWILLFPPGAVLAFVCRPRARH